MGAVVANAAIDSIPPTAKWASKSLFYGGTFSIFGPFLPFLIKNRTFKKGHLWEIHQIFDFDARVSNATISRLMYYPCAIRFASFP
jgi:hypothetical protein